MPSSSMKNSTSTILNLDGTTCIVMGVILIALAGWLSRLTNLPSNIIWIAGVLLLPIGLFMFLTAWKWSSHPFPIWLIVIGNIAWVIASVGLIAFFASPNVFGFALVATQAAVVALFAYLEFRSLPEAA